MCFNAAQWCAYSIIPANGVNPAELVVVFACNTKSHQDEAKKRFEELLEEAAARRNAANREAIATRQEARRLTAPKPLVETDRPLVSAALNGIESILEEMGAR